MHGHEHEQHSNRDWLRSPTQMQGLSPIQPCPPGERWQSKSWIGHADRFVFTFQLLPHNEIQFFISEREREEKIENIVHFFFKIIYTCNTTVIVLTLSMNECTMLRISTTKIKAPQTCFSLLNLEFFSLYNVCTSLSQEMCLYLCH